MAFHKIRGLVMPTLGAHDGSVDVADIPMDFLEPVPQVPDGPRCQVEMLGALVGKSASSAPVATGRVGASNLKKARAQDLFEVMRRRRDQDGATTFKGMKWLRTVPISGGLDTMEDCFKCISESLAQLVKSKHVLIEKPRGARWAVERWKITLL